MVPLEGRLFGSTTHACPDGVLHVLCSLTAAICIHLLAVISEVGGLQKHKASQSTPCTLKLSPVPLDIGEVSKRNVLI